MTKTNFFKTLFDYRFETYITRKIAGIAYLILAWLTTAMGAVVLLSALVQATRSPIYLLIAIAAPIGTLVVVVTLRLLFESSIALVAIAENTSKPSAQG